MPGSQAILTAHLKELSPQVRSIVEEARRSIKAVAPSAQEVASSAGKPKAATYMWKLVRYELGGEDVVGIGAFTRHAALFFPRGRELDDGSGLLQGSGKDSRFIRLESPADVRSSKTQRVLRDAFKLARSGAARENTSPPR